MRGSAEWRGLVQSWQESWWKPRRAGDDLELLRLRWSVTRTVTARQSARESPMLIDVSSVHEAIAQLRQGHQVRIAGLGCIAPVYSAGRIMELRCVAERGLRDAIASHQPEATQAPRGTAPAARPTQPTGGQHG